MSRLYWSNLPVHGIGGHEGKSPRQPEGHYSGSSLIRIGRDLQSGLDSVRLPVRAVREFPWMRSTMLRSTAGILTLSRWAKRDASLTLAESPKNFFIQIFTIAGFQRFAFDQLERSGTIGLALSTQKTSFCQVFIMKPVCEIV
jgi:hypothetical protein